MRILVYKVWQQIYCNGGSSGGLFDDFAGIKSNFEMNRRMLGLSQSGGTQW